RACAKGKEQSRSPHVGTQLHTHAFPATAPSRHSPRPQAFARPEPTVNPVARAFHHSFRATPALWARARESPAMLSSDTPASGAGNQCDECNEEVTMAVRLGDEAPDFTAETTEGTVSLHDYLGGSWGMLFSHPKDFTPVCTTELGAFAKRKSEFDQRNVK